MKELQQQAQELKMGYADVSPVECPLCSRGLPCSANDKLKADDLALRIAHLEALALKAITRLRMHEPETADEMCKELAAK